MKLPAKFLFLAAIYGTLGMCLGIVMGAKEDFSLAPVHAHVNLLGWVALTIYGLSYQVFPVLASSKLAKIQLYTVNTGVIILIPTLSMLLLGNRGVIPVLVIGELLTLASLILFLSNIWKNRMAM